MTLKETTDGNFEASCTAEEQSSTFSDPSRATQTSHLDASNLCCDFWSAHSCFPWWSFCSFDEECKVLWERLRHKFVEGVQSKCYMFQMRNIIMFFKRNKVTRPSKTLLVNNKTSVPRQWNPGVLKLESVGQFWWRWKVTATPLRNFVIFHQISHFHFYWSKWQKTVPGNMLKCKLKCFFEKVCWNDWNERASTVVTC